MTATILHLPIMPKLPTHPLPNRIRYWRKKRGLLLRELAAMLGMEPPNLSRFETGARDMPLARLEAIAHHLDVTVADLLNPEQGGLTDDEREMVQTYREVPEQSRRLIEGVMESQQAWRGQPEVVPLVPRDQKARR